MVSIRVVMYFVMICSSLRLVAEIRLSELRAKRGPSFERSERRGRCSIPSFFVCLPAPSLGFDRFCRTAFQLELQHEQASTLLSTYSKVSPPPFSLVDAE